MTDTTNDTLPHIASIERDHDRVTIYFENDAQLAYVISDGSVHACTYSPAYPDSVLHKTDLLGAGRHLDSFVLDAIERYVNDYRESPTDCDRHWPTLYDALTDVE